MSSQPTLKELGISTGALANQIKNDLLGYLSPIGGIAIVGESDDEKTLTGFNNCIGPKCLVVFTGEEAFGSEDVAELLGRVRKNFEIVVNRGKIMSDPRNSALTSTTGPSRAFYEQLEDIRELVRSIEYPVPMCFNPCEYHGTHPVKSDGWLLDTYVISISIIVDIPRIQVDSPQLYGNGNYLGVNAGAGVQFNKSVYTGQQ